MELSVHVEQGAGHVVVAATGDIDIATSGTFRDTALAALEVGPVDLVLDLSAVTFIDSTGLSVLVLMRRETDERHRRLALVAGRRVRAILKIAGLADVFVVHPTIDSALGDVDDLA